MKDMDDVLNALVGFFLGTFFGILLGGLVARNTVRREAIEQGFAQYNPTNAHFEWKK